ncbi:MAG: hypothetical protein WC477_01785 [Patescibacteria group bacterium]
MKSILIRSSLIWILKNLVYLFASTAGLLLIGAKVSTAVFSLLSLTLYALCAFFAAEWAFHKPARMGMLGIWVVILVTFAVDLVCTALFYSWVYQSNILSRQAFWPQFLSFLIHTGAVVGAYELRRRRLASGALSEGLES